MAGLTDKGLVIKTYTEILSDINTNLKSGIGFDIDTSEKSTIGIFNSVFAMSDSQVWEALQAVHDAFKLSRAEGINLDDLVILNGLYRRPARFTEGLANFVGDDGTVVGTSTILRSLKGDTFNPKADVTISLRRCIGFTTEVNTVRTNTAYIIAISGESYIYTTPATFDDTYDNRKQILTELKTKIDAGSYAKGTVKDGQEPSLEIVANDTSIDMQCAVTTYLSVGSVVTQATIQSTEVGEIAGDAFSITKIDTPVNGFDSIYNPRDLVTGSFAETDEELRRRFFASLRSTGTATLDAIRTRVSEVELVQNVRVFENKQNVTDSDGRPAKSFEVYVVEGVDDNIAQAIWDTKPAGILDFGNDTGVAVDSGGVNHTMYFSRPKDWYIYVRVTYTPYTEETPTNDLEDVIKNSVVEYGRTLNIGDDVIPNRALAYIYPNTSGVQVTQIQMAKSDVPDIHDWNTLTWTSDKIQILDTEISQWGTTRVEVTKL